MSYSLYCYADCDLKDKALHIQHFFFFSEFHLYFHCLCRELLSQHRWISKGRMPFPFCFYFFLAKAGLLSEKSPDCFTHIPKPPFSSSLQFFNRRIRKRPSWMHFFLCSKELYLFEFIMLICSGVKQCEIPEFQL